MPYDYALALILAALLTTYLAFALTCPERF